MKNTKELDKIIDDRVGELLKDKGNINLKVDELQKPIGKARRIIQVQDQFNAGQMKAGISGPLTETAEEDRLYYDKKPFVLGLSGLFFVGAQSVKQMTFKDSQDSPVDFVFKETKFND